MTIQCPNGHPCRWSDRACSKCGFRFTVGAITRHYWECLARGVRERAVVECPHCHAASPLATAGCVHCGRAFTVEEAYRAAVAPAVGRYHRFVDEAGPRTWRCFRWGYFTVSAGVLWLLLAYVETQVGADWIKHAALSVVYLAVFLLGCFWFVNRAWLLALATHRSVSVRLGLLMNCFSGLILLQIFIGQWWIRSLIMAGLLLVVWLAFNVFLGVLLPTFCAVASVFFGQSPSNTHKPTTPQGRKAVYD